jgi:large subunit ribosomal protein L15
MVSEKTNKLRGSKSHGYGSKKKHRGKGSRGGKGMGGSSKHNRSWVYSNDKDYFGKHGFTSLYPRKNVINLYELGRMTKNSKEIDLTALGVDKLLSSGEIKTALTVKVNNVSKTAKKKIEDAGGKIVSVQKSAEVKETPVADKKEPVTEEKSEPKDE